MKKILLPGLFLLIAFTVLAQKKKFEVGFQGGVNLNSAYGNAFEGTSLSYTTGLSMGGNAKLSLSEQIGIRLQLSYEQFGWANRNLYFEDSVNGLAKADVIFKFNYLNLPVMAEYTFGRRVKFVLNAGGFASILLNSKILLNHATPVVVRDPVVISNTNNHSKINAGLAAGVGVQIPLTSKIAFAINARNYTGLTNTNNKVPGYNSSIKTMTFSFLTGLTFRL